MNVKSYGNTDLGKMRRRNEDAFLDNPDNHLYAVADGLGGLAAGDRASQLAISILKAHQQEALKEKKPINLSRVFADAHEAIVKMGTTVDPVRGSGTTFTVALVDGENVSIAHAGDSAAYLFRPDEWKKLTTDHTEAEDFRKNRPGEPVPPIFEHTLTRCLGQPGAVAADLLRHSLRPGDRLLLCTDGVTRSITPEEIRTWICNHREPQGIVDEVLKIANRRGGADNSTAVAIFVE